jgi:hypothetical protein
VPLLGRGTTRRGPLVVEQSAQVADRRWCRRCLVASCPATAAPQR